MNLKKIITTVDLHTPLFWPFVSYNLLGIYHDDACRNCNSPSGGWNTAKSGYPSACTVIRLASRIWLSLSLS